MAEVLWMHVKRATRTQAEHKGECSAESFRLTTRSRWAYIARGIIAQFRWDKELGCPNGGHTRTQQASAVVALETEHKGEYSGESFRL